MRSSSFSLHGHISALTESFVATRLDGFRRITEGRDKGGYFHEFFLQGRRGLVKKVKRKKLTTPKASKQDLNMATRICNEMLNNHVTQMPASYMVPTMQQMMMMNQGGPFSLEAGMGGATRMAPVRFGSFGGPSSHLAATRDQLYPALEMGGPSRDQNRTEQQLRQQSQMMPLYAGPGNSAAPPNAEPSDGGSSGYMRAPKEK